MTASDSGQFDEGYPRSSDADLDPESDEPQTLDDADRAAGSEHRVALEGHGPDDAISDDEPQAEL